MGDRVLSLSRPTARPSARPPVWLLALMLAGGAALAAPPPSPAQARSEDPAARRVYQEAQKRVQAGDDAGALTELGLLIQQFPNDVLAPRALLQTLELRRGQLDEAGAEAALKKLLEGYPRSPEAASGFIVEGEMAVERARSAADYEQARSTFRRVSLLFGRDQFEKLDARVLARLRSAEVGLQLGDREGALGELLAAIEDEAPGRYSGRARLLYGRTLLADPGQSAAALEVLQKLADEGPAAAASQPPKPGESATAGANPGANPGANSSPAERAAARRLIALAHRQVVRPRAGQPQWSRVARYPAAGLTLREPEGVAAADDGRIVVVDRKAELVALLGEAGELISQRPLPDADRPAFSNAGPGAGAGAAYVVAGSQIVLPFDGQSVGFLQPKTGKEAPLKGMIAAERSPFGDWYVLAKGYDGLLNYQSPRVGQEILTGAGQRYELTDLDSDDFGRLYLLDADKRQVLRLGMDRRSVEIVAQGTWKKAAALAIDALGNLYVLDRGNRKIEVYDAQGHLKGAAGPSLGGGIELKDPQDLAVDGSGRLVLTDRKLPFVVVLE